MAGADKPTVVPLVTRLSAQQREQVEVLELALSKARAGEFSAVTVAAVTQDGASYSHTAASDVATALLGALAMAQQRVMQNIMV